MQKLHEELEPIQAALKLKAQGGTDMAGEGNRGTSEEKDDEEKVLVLRDYDLPRLMANTLRKLGTEALEEIPNITPAQREEYKCQAKLGKRQSGWYARRRRQRKP